MRLKFLEQWKFKLQGRAVPVIKCTDITNDGRIYTLQIVGKCKDRANTILNTWDSKEWEKDPNFGKITFIDEKGIETYPYLVSSSGKTVGLYTQPSAFPAREDILGHWSMMDDIADAMDLNKSLKNIAIGLIIGIFLGWLIVGPMISGVMS